MKLQTVSELWLCGGLRLLIDGMPTLVHEGQGITTPRNMYSVGVETRLTAPNGLENNTGTCHSDVVQGWCRGPSKYCGL